MVKEKLLGKVLLRVSEAYWWCSYGCAPLNKKYFLTVLLIGYLN